MDLKWVLLFALMLFVNTVTSQPCQRLFMQGLDNTQLSPFAELSGLYIVTNISDDAFSNFPAYRHEIHPNEFFLYNSTLEALDLGHGLLIAQVTGSPTTNVQYPYMGVITEWRVRQLVTDRLDLLFEFVSVL